MTVDHIITEIYKNPDGHFNEGTEELNGQIVQIPKPPKKHSKKL